MKKIICITFLLLIFPALVVAHPGRTAADGCHYCRTNCDSWGEEWGERHCHTNRIEELLPIMTPEKPKSSFRRVNQKQTPGWEYNIKVKNTSIRTEEKNKVGVQ
jgi:hypothetical protein